MTEKMSDNVTHQLTDPYRKSDAIAVGIAIFFPLFSTLLYFVAMAGLPEQLQKSSYSLCKAVQFMLPLFWVFWVQRRRPDFMLPRLPKPAPIAKIPARWYGVIEGLGFGAAVLAGIVIIYTYWLKPIGFLSPGSPFATAIAEKVSGFGLHSVSAFIAFAVFLSLVHSYLEEYYWRWFVFGQLRRMMPVGLAICLGAIGFMLHHVVVLGTYFGYLCPATWLLSLGVAIGGAYWSWLYQRTGSLLGPWLSHVVVDAAIFIVGYDLLRNILT